MQRGAKPDERREFMVEHIASRKEWGAYVDLVTHVRRSVVTEADEFLAQLRPRIEQAVQKSRQGPGG